ncbi:NAD(P)/FAD-dependent oxidoreductase [Mucilaginibacter gynuensis]|uniref:NAD(P)/FAD-dependent oxidoreductase n=1 Tax=Mucilaginibacter gynuensis TaxID=1302236 RepID=A0ABP8G2R0_9SPHI
MKLDYEVIIIGGSYAGLSAAMTLGRSLRKTLIINSGKPCNRQTPHSHNFITQDGEAPAMIAAKAMTQVMKYPDITYQTGLATGIETISEGFRITIKEGGDFTTRKVIFATGIADTMPAIPGFAECWGISVLHCPYCHGYEVRNNNLGLLVDAGTATDFYKLIRHWSPIITLFTNGAKLTEEQYSLFAKRKVTVRHEHIKQIEHDNGYMSDIHLSDGTTVTLDALFARVPFKQHCELPQALGCTLTEMGYLQVDEMGHTNIPGIYAAGDNTTPMRSVATATAAGNKTGAMLNKDLIDEDFL